MTAERPLARGYLLASSAAAAGSVLALEVLAARAIAPVLGSGSMVWSMLLAVAMGSLAAGNALGGVLADGKHAAATFCWSLVLAAGAVVAIAQVHQPALMRAADRPLMSASIAAALLTQAVPMLLLGTITPMLISVGSKGGRAGRWSGWLLAAGSIGGIAGAIAAGPVLLPAIGITRTYLLIGVALSATAAGAAVIYRRWIALSLGVAVMAWGSILLMRHRETALIIESSYGQIEVREQGGGRVMLIDGMPQTGLPHLGPPMPGDGLRHGYLMELALLHSRPQRALVIGLGAGLAPRLLAAYGIACESVEIDPMILWTSRKHFGFEGEATIADGRRFLARDQRTWDLIVLDVCTSDQLAWHLFTVEAMSLLRQRLSPDGILAIQFISDGGPFEETLLRTVGRVFPGPLVAMDHLPPPSPRWIFAARLPLPDPPEDMPFALARSALGEGEILTDDHFPADRQWADLASRWRRLARPRP